jgi:DNA repair protein RadC
MVLCLDVKNVPMAAALIHIGGRSDAVLDASAVFHPAVLVQAVNIIVAHNHPSGDIVPSFDDIEITKRLVAAGKNLGVGILDHLVLTDDDNRYGSFLDRGLMS